MGIDTARPPEGARFVCEPSVFAAETVFANEVVTALPYYSVPEPGQCEPYVGYMIDEQRLLGLKVRLVRWSTRSGCSVAPFLSLFWEIDQASPFTIGDLGDVDVYTFLGVRLYTVFGFGW